MKIKTLKDVAAHFGASLPTNEMLSRRIYKDTHCGAWAKVIERRKPMHRYENWTALYTRKKGGKWTLKSLRLWGKPEIAANKAPAQVRRYFWDGDGDLMHRFLMGRAGRRALRHVVTESVTRTYQGRKETVFQVGSIVEGSDVEIGPVTVVLPCDPEDLNRAVQQVEDEALYEWDQANQEDEP